MANKKNYRKKPLWQWILIYVAIAVVVYGGIYYFFFTKHSTSTFQKSLIARGSLPNRQTAFPLTGVNTSKEFGEATLKQHNGEFTVTISLPNEPANSFQPASINSGVCPNVGQAKLKLNPVVDGKSVTSLQISLDQLKQFQPLVISIHKSKKDMTTIAACGTISL